jgi:hypothetical protein
MATNNATNNTFDGPLPVDNGGTGNTTLTQYCVLAGDGTSAIVSIPNGSTGQVLTATIGTTPTWQAPAQIIGQNSILYLDPTIAVSDNLSLSISPPVTPEVINSKAITAATSPVFFERFVSGSLGRTSIPAGTWQLELYAGASSIINSNLIKVRINRRVLQTGLTGTFTGAGPTRTFTVTGGAPFVAGDANVSVLLASLIETPTQTAWISGFTSASEVTVTLTDPAFVNVAGVQLTAIYYLLFTFTSPELDDTAVKLYSIASTQPAFTVGLTDSLVAAFFGETDGNRTLSLYYGGNNHFTHIDSTLTVVGTNIFAWTKITADQNMNVNNGYICNKAGLLTLTLPATAVVGDLLRVTGVNTDVGWRVAQNAGQTIYFGESNTTTGVGGYLESTKKRDSIEMVCVTNNTEFNVLDFIGNITIA